MAACGGYPLEQRSQFVVRGIPRLRASVSGTRGLQDGVGRVKPSSASTSSLLSALAVVVNALGSLLETLLTAMALLHSLRNETHWCYLFTVVDSHPPLRTPRSHRQSDVGQFHGRGSMDRGLSRLAWNMGALRRNLVLLVLRDERAMSCVS